MGGIFKSIGKLYNNIANMGVYLQDPLLLVIRLYWGWSFFQAGCHKFMHLERTASFFTSLNIPLPAFNAYLVATAETFGGLMFILGLGSRLAALPLTIVMITAYFTAHNDAVMKLFENPKIFFGEEPFLFLYASLIILAFGSGLLSIDGLSNYFSKGKSK